MPQGFDQDTASPLGGEALSILFGQPSGNVARIDLHLEELEIFVTVHPVFLRISNLSQQRFRFGVQPGGDNDTRKIMQDHWEKMIFNVLSKNAFVDFNLCLQVQDIRILIYSIRSKKD